MKTIATITFTSELVLEYSSIPTPSKLGTFHNRMEFRREGNSGCIIWNYGKQAADEDETVIGLWFEGDKLVDYDGVFSLPLQAELLLEAAGIDLGDCSMYEPRKPRD